MITPSFSPTATERVLPKLTLDFTTASLDSRITFTRTTSSTNPATYVSSSGLITNATNNQPRFDYDPIALTCKGLLIEESRGNLCFSTEDFSTTWVAGGTAAIQTNQATAPDGTNSADLLTVTTGGPNSITQYTTVATNTTYTISYFVKSKDINAILIRALFTVGTTVSTFSNFNFSTKTFTDTVGAGIFSYQEYKDGWFRISVVIASGNNTTLAFRIGGTITTPQTGTQAYIWGAQVEAGSFITSYIPNLGVTGTLTRNADIATMTGTNFSNWWVATNGASNIWLIPKSTSTLAYLSFDDNTSNNSIIIANSTTSGQSTITSGGSLQATLTAGTITANSINKVGCSWNTNNCAATANAATPATTASATIPTVTQLRIGSNGSLYANAWIQKLFYWPQRITNNEIQAFTK